MLKRVFFYSFMTPVKGFGGQESGWFLYVFCIGCLSLPVSTFYAFVARLLRVCYAFLTLTSKPRKATSPKLALHIAS